MPERQPVIPPGVSPNPNLSPGVRVGDLLFVSGQIGVDPDGNIAEGCEAQSRQVMANIRAVVEAAGGQMEDVAKITCFLTNMDDYAAYGQVRRETWPANPPASSTVGISTLVTPNLLGVSAHTLPPLVVEVEAIVRLPD